MKASVYASEKRNTVIANVLSISRIPLSLCLLAFSASCVPFAVLYLLCGLSDVLDGFFARNCTHFPKVPAGKTGERLDSLADLFFAAAYAVKILPLLHLDGWIWLWTAVIAVVKIGGIIKNGCIAHSFANKLTGLLTFLLPLTVRMFDATYGAMIVCGVATFAAIGEWLKA